MPTIFIQPVLAPRRLPQRTAIRFTTILCGVFIAGCVGNAPDDDRIYRAILDRDLHGIELPADNRLSLSLALKLANAGNESLGLQGEQLIRAIAQKRRSVAAFWPTIDFAPSVSFAKSEDGIDTNLDAPFDATLVIFDGLANIHRLWRDRYLIDVERERLLEAQERLLFDVASVYYTIRRAEAQVEVLDSSIALQQQRVADARGREEAGLSRSLDVAQSEAQASATRVQRIEAQRQVVQGRLLLEFLTNAPVRQMELADDFDPVEPEDFVTLLDEAFRNRSELRATENAVRAAQHSVEVAIAQYYPGITLDLTAFLYRESAPDERTWAGILQVNLPIFTAGRIHAEVRTAWSFLREALLIDSQTRRRIRNEVNQNFENLKASELRLKELDVSLRASRLAFDQAEASYHAGLATNLDRVSAQDALLQAQLAFRSEEIDQKLLHVEMLRAEGILRETLLGSSTTQPATLPMTGSAP